MIWRVTTNLCGEHCAEFMATSKILNCCRFRAPTICDIIPCRFNAWFAVTIDMSGQWNQIRTSAPFTAEQLKKRTDRIKRKLIK